MNSHSSSNFKNSGKASAEEFDHTDFCFFQLPSGPFKDHSYNNKFFVMARHKGNGGWIPWDNDGPMAYSGEELPNLHFPPTTQNDNYVLTGAWVGVKVKIKEVKKFEYSF